MEAIAVVLEVRPQAPLTQSLKLQALVYDILPLEEGAGKRCSECGSLCDAVPHSSLRRQWRTWYTSCCAMARGHCLNICSRSGGILGLPGWRL